MWSTMIAPQGHGFMPAKEQKRPFGMLHCPLPITTGKSFKNPNFVNNFDKYRNPVKPVDSSLNKNYQNSCHTHIIDSIKEKCPEIIPTVEEITTPIPETTPEHPVMCLVNNKTTRPNSKASKSEHTPRKNRQLGKHSRQNHKRQEINEMLQEEDIQDTFNDTMDLTPTPPPHTLNLADFIVKKSKVHSSSKPMKKSIEIPISNSEMVLAMVKMAASPCRSRQYSVTDSEDSFIVFDHDGNEKELKNNDNDDDEYSINEESLCNSFNRLRKPSLCESEDSFILFEGDHDNHCQYDEVDNDDFSDYCYDSSEDESDQEINDLIDDSHKDSHKEDHSDETDSSFAIIPRKKVRFASDHKLCEVHPMIKWSYAYQAARKGPWEMYARDRCRFRERIWRAERDIKHIFDPQHRARIYKERFENI